MPSRASILTGHHQTGVMSMRMEGDYPGSDYDPEQCPFWPAVFRKNGGPGKVEPGYSTDNYTRWALDFIEGREGRVEDRPWFLWLCYGGVHGPFTPAERHLQELRRIEALFSNDLPAVAELP